MLAVLIIGQDKDYALIGIVLLLAVCLHFTIETVVMLKRGSFRRRLSDLSEYREHRPLTAPLEHVAAWRSRAWTIDLSKAVR